MGKKNNKKFDQEINCKNAKTKSKGRNNQNYRKWDNTEKPNSKQVYDRDLMTTENDVSWYSKIGDQLLNDTCSIPLTYPLGGILNLGPYASTAWGSTINTTSVPGVAAIKWVPTFGYADNPNSPINVAARQIYSWVRHANSGHANYDSPDLMLYLMAVDQVNLWLEYMKRIYGVAMTYNNQNRYYPNTILYANVMNYEDVYDHLAELRAKINTYAAKAQSLCVPNDITFYERHKWLSSGLFLDSMDSAKAQTYLFVPLVYYTFQLDDDSAGMLKGHVWTWTGPGETIIPHTVSDLYDVMDSILDPILMSEDMGIMGGDILKAYGQERMFKFTGITEDYSVLPAYHRDVLDQIHNATLVGNYKVPDLKQDSGKQYLTFKPEARMNRLDIEAGVNYGFMNRIIDFHRDGITPKDIMVATRLTNILDPGDVTAPNVEPGTYYAVKTCGSEIAQSMEIFRLAKDETDGYVGPQRMRVDAVNQVSASISSLDNAAKKGVSSTANQMIQTIAGLSVFNDHPIVTYNVAVDGIVSDLGNNIIADLGNYGYVTQENLINMAEVALLSQLSAI